MKIPYDTVIVAKMGNRKEPRWRKRSQSERETIERTRPRPDHNRK